MVTTTNSKTLKGTKNYIGFSEKKKIETVDEINYSHHYICYENRNVLQNSKSQKYRNIELK